MCKKKKTAGAGKWVWNNVAGGLGRGKKGCGKKITGPTGAQRR